jgi:hypothetical protein
LSHERHLQGCVDIGMGSDQLVHRCGVAILRRYEEGGGSFLPIKVRSIRKGENKLVCGEGHESTGTQSELVASSQALDPGRSRKRAEQQ